jgi:hypothetical protein
MTGRTFSQHRKRRFFLLSATLLAAMIVGVPALAEPACPATKVIRAVEGLLRADGQAAQLEMRVVRPRSTRTLRMRMWFQNGGSDGNDRSLARVEAPAAERGVASLRLGTKMWSFVPSTGRVQQVPDSMMLGSWMGSDWTNDDMVRESSYVDDYRVGACKVVDHQGGSAYEIHLKARSEAEVAWQKLVMFVRHGGENDLQPLRTEYYSTRAGQMVLARSMIFSDSREMGGRRIPTKMTLEPEGRPGHRTEMRYLNIQFDTEIPERIFSLSNLQRSR